MEDFLSIDETDNMPNRTMCDALKEMRTILKKTGYLNLAVSKPVLEVLIEEVQSMGNRMEAALWTQHDIKKLEARKKSLAKEIKDLKEIVSDIDKPIV